ncbi:hypothetical protein E2320_022209 [Naja naja]|nr:hypothetical protein E2320_022209 [Naja naja]
MAAPMAAAAAGSAGAPEELEAPATTPAATTAAGPAGPSRPARLPLSRVKALVKADPDVSLASQEAVFILARAATMPLKPWMSLPSWKERWTEPFGKERPRGSLPPSLPPRLPRKTLREIPLYRASGVICT